MTHAYRCDFYVPGTVPLTTMMAIRIRHIVAVLYSKYHLGVYLGKSSNSTMSPLGSHQQPTVTYLLTIQISFAPRYDTRWLKFTLQAFSGGRTDNVKSSYKSSSGLSLKNSHLDLVCFR
ncbi:5557_t:CDS:2 [Paraglomus occultum]|uniref:5557_t:CDS:1 n=1 Tax=Paraglomus occultum TaxID=144539 RepID=A0A9N9AN38_9GLOM|nr:5557_t:CDS:2 [Paraglomus occultum]